VTTNRIRKRDAVEVELEQRVAELEQQQAELVALVHQLIGAGPRDHQDLALISAVHEFAASHVETFTAAEVIAWATVRPELRDALERADIDDAKQLGELLHRCRGRTLAGLLVTREGHAHGRARWRVELREAVPPGGSVAR